jgi:hypothetical protein
VPGMRHGYEWPVRAEQRADWLESPELRPEV